MLTYTISKPGQIHISIFDATGRFITDVLTATKSAGTYCEHMRLENLAAGIYFVKVKTDSHNITRAITVLR
jgi:hypothetical protein